MEIECARAELETVRSDLWERAEEEARGGVPVAAKGWMFPFRVALVGVVLLLCASLPLSLEDPMFFASSVARSSATVLEFVTPDERDLLRAMRSALSEWAERRENSGETDVSLRGESMVSVVPGGAGGAASSWREAVPVSPSSALFAVRERTEEKGKRETVPLEDVLALVQKGERALRGTAVPVVEEDKTERPVSPLREEGP